MHFKVSVPATSANMGPGFDFMGIALNLRNHYFCEFGPQIKDFELNASFEPLALETADASPDKMLPLDRDNLVWQGYRSIFEQAGHSPLPVKISLQVGIPLTRGLGSSSTAILAGMVIANEILRQQSGRVFTLEQILDYAILLEGHPDNLAPALYGGWIISIPEEESKKYIVQRVPLKAPLKMAGVIPHVSLSTEKARRVLPDHYSRSDVIFQAGRSSLYTHLLSQDNWSEREYHYFKLAIQDKVHQPQRSGIVPAMIPTFAHWYANGACGAYLSGAGTTMIGFWRQEQNLAGLHLGEALAAEGIGSTPFYPEIDLAGLTIDWL